MKWLTVFWAAFFVFALCLVVFDYSSGSGAEWHNVMNVLMALTFFCSQLSLLIEGKPALCGWLRISGSLSGALVALVACFVFYDWLGVFGIVGWVLFAVILFALDRHKRASEPSERNPAA